MHMETAVFLAIVHHRAFVGNMKILLRQLTEGVAENRCTIYRQRGFQLELVTLAVTCTLHAGTGQHAVTRHTQLHLPVGDRLAIEIHSLHAELHPHGGDARRGIHRTYLVGIAAEYFAADAGGSQGARTGGSHTDTITAAHILLTLGQGQLLAESAELIHIEHAAEQAAAIRCIEIQLQLAMLRVGNIVLTIHRTQKTAHIHLLTGAIQVAVGPQHGAQLRLLVGTVIRNTGIKGIRAQQAEILTLAHQDIPFAFRKGGKSLLQCYRLAHRLSTHEHSLATLHHAAITVAQHQHTGLVTGRETEGRQIRNRHQHIVAQHQILRLHPQFASRLGYCGRRMKVHFHHIQAGLRLAAAEGIHIQLQRAGTHQRISGFGQLHLALGHHLSTGTLQEDTVVVYLPGALMPLGHRGHFLLGSQPGIDTGAGHCAGIKLKSHIAAALLLLEVAADNRQSMNHGAGIPIAYAQFHRTAVHGIHTELVVTLQRQVAQRHISQSRTHRRNIASAGEILQQRQTQCAGKTLLHRTFRQHRHRTLQHQLHAGGSRGMAILHQHIGNLFIIFPHIHAVGVGGAHGVALPFKRPLIAHAQLTAIHHSRAGHTILSQHCFHTIQRKLHGAEHFLQAIFFHHGIEAQLQCVHSNAILLTSLSILLQRSAEVTVHIDGTQITFDKATSLLCLGIQAPDTPGRKRAARAYHHIAGKRGILVELLPFHPLLSQRAQHVEAVAMAKLSLLHDYPGSLTTLEKVTLFIHLEAGESILQATFRAQRTGLYRILITGCDQRRTIRVRTQILVHQRRGRCAEAVLVLLQTTATLVAGAGLELQHKLGLHARTGSRLDTQAILIHPQNTGTVTIITTDGE